MSFVWVETVYGASRAAASTGILEQADRVARVEVDPQVVGADRVEDPDHLGRGEVDVVLEREHDAVLRGGLRRLLEHRHDAADQLLARAPSRSSCSPR